MHSFKLSRRHLVGLVSLTSSLVFAAFSVASLPAAAQVAPATACPVLSLGNPNPGDNLLPGAYFISGTAYDPAATSGSGVSRVDLFLGQRENGGILLGSAVPGSGPGGDPRSFSAKVTLPKISRGTDFSAYAVSSITGQQTAITFAVYVGVPPKKKAGGATPTPLPTTSTMTTTCPAASAGAPAPNPAAQAAAASAPAAPSAPAPAPTPGASVAGGSMACPVLSLANPNPGDNLLSGDYIISGTANDPAATSGSGVSRVDLFLGQRENGGNLLGSALPGSGPGGDPRSFSVKVTLPKINRGTDFSAYAISSITGQQSGIAFAVYVGVPPKIKGGAATPTPLPKTATTTTTCAAHT